MKKLSATVVAMALLSLAVLLPATACGGGSITEPPQEPSVPLPPAFLRITTATTGPDVDPDGYALAVEARGSEFEFAIDTSDTVLVSGLWVGDHEVRLEGLSANCGVSGEDPLRVTLVEGRATDARFDVACSTRIVRNVLADQIVFTGNRGGAPDLYVMNADGSDAMRLTTDGGSETHPSPSPDGKRIAYTLYTEIGGPWSVPVSSIYVVNVDGSGQALLADVSPFSVAAPAWSPDGTKIAFSSYQDGTPGCSVMNPDGSGLAWLPTGARDAACRGWSPDGSSLVFSKDDGIYTMRLDGTDRVRLLEMSLTADPVFSPDGSKIAFQGQDLGTQSDIFVVNADGTGLTQLRNDPAMWSSPSWSPDGSRIAFASGQDGDSEIFTIRPDGTGLVKLTNNRTGDYGPAWSWQ